LVEAVGGCAPLFAVANGFCGAGGAGVSGGGGAGGVHGRVLTALRTLAQQEKTTLANVVLALFNLLLYQSSKQNDLCIGIAIANRTHADLENLLGFFVNILPLRVQMSDEQQFPDLLQQVTTRMNEALTYQEYPFDLLVEKLNPVRYAFTTVHN
jgi:non-ribosomal peptide synthetase component F